jgi:PAS domain S-box-containing protein
MGNSNLYNTTVKSRYLLLAVLLLSFAVIFTSWYFTSPVNKIYADVVFATAVLVMIVVIGLFVKDINRFERQRIAQLLDGEYLRLTLNSLDEGVITTNMQGMVQSMNPSAELLTGWKFKDAAGLPLERIYDVVNEETGKHIPNIVNRILREGKPVDFENNTILYSKQAHKIIISNNGSPVRDAEGNMVGVVLVFRDVTERKRMSDEKDILNRRLLLATQSAGMGIWEWDIQNDILTWDDAIRMLYKLDDTIYESPFEAWTERIHPADKLRVAEDIQNAVKGLKEYNTEFRITNDDGSVRHIKATGNVVRGVGGQPVKMIGANWDVTTRKLAEAERAKITDDLLQRNKRMDHFSHIVSHNLRAPVATILGLAELLEYENEQTSDMVNIIQGMAVAANDLDRVIRDMNKILMIEDTSPVQQMESN